MILSTSIEALQKSKAPQTAAIDYPTFLNSLGSQIEWTAMFFHTNWNGRKYAQYEISNGAKKYTKAARILGDFRLYLDDDANKDFHIFKANKEYTNNGTFLKATPINLKEYLTANLPEEIIDDSKKFDLSDFEGDETARFKFAEMVYLKSLYNNIQVEKTLFIPLPNMNEGNLIGMIYAIYDDEKVDKNALENLLENINQ